MITLIVIIGESLSEEISKNALSRLTERG